MRLLFIFIFIGSFFKAQSQPDKIKIKKEDYSIYFFNQGKKSDTINSNNNTFVLKLGVSRRCNTFIEIENGKLIETKNDSLFKLMYMPGMNYRHLYRDTVVTELPAKSTIAPAKTRIYQKCGLFTTQVNGSSGNPQSKTIVIKFKSFQNDTIYLSNKYYFK